jgi:hypothetical protein
MNHFEKIIFSDESFLTAGVLSSRLVSPPSASDDLDLHPWDISLDSPFRGAYSDLYVPGA